MWYKYVAHANELCSCKSWWLRWQPKRGHSKCHDGRRGEEIQNLFGLGRRQAKWIIRVRRTDRQYPMCCDTLTDRQSISQITATPRCMPCSRTGNCITHVTTAFYLLVVGKTSIVIWQNTMIIPIAPSTVNHVESCAWNRHTFVFWDRFVQTGQGMFALNTWKSNMVCCPNMCVQWLISLGMPSRVCVLSVLSEFQLPATRHIQHCVSPIGVGNHPPKHIPDVWSASTPRVHFMNSGKMTSCIHDRHTRLPLRCSRDSLHMLRFWQRRCITWQRRCITCWIAWWAMFKTGAFLIAFFCYYSDENRIMVFVHAIKYSVKETPPKYKKIYWDCHSWIYWRRSAWPVQWCNSWFVTVVQVRYWHMMQQYHRARSHRTHAACLRSCFHN